jgi:hypothetical protein
LAQQGVDGRISETGQIMPNKLHNLLLNKTLDLMKFVISAFIGTGRANKSKSENKSIYFCPIVVWSSDEVINLGKIAEHSFINIVSHLLSPGSSTWWL